MSKNKCIEKEHIQIKVPEGYARDGDSDIKYIDGKRCRITVRLEVKEEKYI